MWACLYRICFNDRLYELDLNPKKYKKHAHMINGESSADEHESILISEMTSDCGEDMFDEVLE